MPYGTAVVEWADGEGLHFFPFLLLCALHSMGSTTSRLCSHHDFAFFTLQSHLERLWKCIFPLFAAPTAVVRHFLAPFVTPHRVL